MISDVSQCSRFQPQIRDYSVLFFKEKTLKGRCVDEEKRSNLWNLAKNSDDSICIPLWRIFGFALVRILSFYRTSKDKLHVRKILSREIIALNGRYVRREERMVHYYFWYFTCIYNTIQLIHYNFLKMFSKLINLYSKSCNGEWNCTSDKSLTNSSTTCSILKIFE